MSYSFHHDTLSPQAIDSSWADWCALVEESNQLRQSLLNIQIKHHREREIAAQQLQLMRNSHIALAAYCTQLRTELTRLDPGNPLTDPALQPGGSAAKAPQPAMREHGGQA